MHKRNLPKIALALVTAVLGTASPAWCDSFSLTLVSVVHNSGINVYGYGITVPAGSSITFNGSQTITLTGLSGVIGAAVTVGSPLTAGWFQDPSTTSDSVTFVSSGATYTEGTFDGFFVDSTAPQGTISWAGQTSVGTFSGTAGGPVSPAPEPDSVSLLLIGMTGLALLVFFSRRKGVLSQNQFGEVL